MADSITSPLSCLIDLVKGFPTGRRQSGSNHLYPSLTGIRRRTQKPQLKALKTATSPFWFVLQPLDLLQPLVMIVVSINDFQSKSVGITSTFVLANLLFFLRIYIGIAVIYHWCDAILEKGLNDGTGARCTAGVKENRSLPHRCLYLCFFRFLHCLDVSTSLDMTKTTSLDMTKTTSLDMTKESVHGCRRICYKYTPFCVTLRPV